MNCKQGKCFSWHSFFAFNKFRISNLHFILIQFDLYAFAISIRPKCINRRQRAKLHTARVDTYRSEVYSKHICIYIYGCVYRHHIRTIESPKGTWDACVSQICFVPYSAYYIIVYGLCGGYSICACIGKCAPLLHNANHKQWKSQTMRKVRDADAD